MRTVQIKERERERELGTQVSILSIMERRAFDVNRTHISL